MNTDIALTSLPETPDLAAKVTRSLIYLGYLDPPFQVQLTKVPGPTYGVPRWSNAAMDALQWWCYLNNVDPLSMYLRAEDAEQLFNAEKPPLSESGFSNQALRLALWMEANGLYVNRALGVNTVYLEGVSLDGTVNADRPDEWNDLCVWFKVAPHGLVSEMGRAVCTTEPGRHYTVNPLHPEGCARLAFGQYKAWAAGMHQRRQPALVQAAPLKVHRDTDRSMTRSKKDTVRVVSGAGINQHTTGPGLAPSLVGPYSAGCLVKRDFREHMDWLEACSEDYRAKAGGYLHVATVLDGSRVPLTSG